MKYYLINLDKSKERLKTFTKNFSEIFGNEDFTRVSGVEFVGDYIHKGRAACSCAHWKIFNMALQSDYKEFTIFEDDAFFYEHTKPLVSSCLQYLKDKSWDMLYWGCVPREEENIPNPLIKTEDKSILKILNSGTTHAITHNREFISRIITEFPKTDNFYDWMLWTEKNICIDVFLRRYQKEGNSYMPHKLCASQYNGYSYIDESFSNRGDVIADQFNKHK
tara:strand:+ start:437 stop:1099 length:663 start_codon:yes stop_codon:yes gene_type:complete